MPRLRASMKATADNPAAAANRSCAAKSSGVSVHPGQNARKLTPSLSKLGANVITQPTIANLDAQ